MKKIYSLTVALSLLQLATQAQVIQGALTNHPVSITGTTVTYANVNKRSAFVIDNAGNKWLGLNSGLSSSFQLMKFNNTQWDTFPAFTAISATNMVNALAADANNNVWIGSNMGLTKYNGTTFTTYNMGNSALANDTITALACGNGMVYVGTKKGLSVFNGTTFTNYNAANNGMHSNVVNCITYENPSSIWLGDNSGLEKFDGSTFTFNYVTGNSTADVVNCIYVDAQNNKWIGTNANGAIKYNNSTFYSMGQLFSSTLIQKNAGSTKWPTLVKTICKGPKGGAFFCYQSTGGASINLSLEVQAGNLYLYQNNVAGASSPTGNQAIMQYDQNLNKIFIMVPTGNPSSVLFSYDTTGTLVYTNRDFLDINNATALIRDNSDQHNDYSAGRPMYFVPSSKNNSPLFASAMWLGGYNGGTLHTAAMTYRQNGMDFWPGPLDTTNATIDTAIMNQYDKVWKVNRFDIASFIYHWNAGDVQNGTFVPVAAILNWPANTTGNVSRNMAPYVDVNHNGVYDPIHDGDYPLIKGDQMIWWVFNDKFAAHHETGGQSFGVEIHGSAYAFTCPSIADSNATLNNSTFYHYEIFNRSANTYDSTSIGLWIDSDLGFYNDDYIGCDVMNDFGYIYNGDNYDEDFGLLTGYHNNLPVFACNILGGPVADVNDGLDNNHNCQIDEPGERCMMDGFIYYNNTGSPVNGNPPSSNGYNAYNNLINNRWINGTPMTYGAQGLTAGGQACKYLYPGLTDPYGYGLGGSCNNPIAMPGSYGTTGWTEKQAGNTPGDRRFMTNVGKFTMKPYSKYDLDYALVFTQDSANCDTNSTCLINRATQDNIRVKRWFNNNSFPSCLDLSTVGIKKNSLPQLNLNLYPNPANTNVYVEFNETQNHVTIEVYDMIGNLVSGYNYNQLDKYATIPVSTLQSGVYLVKIQSATGSVYKKFVKE